MQKQPCIQATGADRSSYLQQLHSVAMAVVMTFSVWLGPILSARAESPVVSKPAPDFALASSNGHNLRLSEFRGDVVIVNFWSAGCGRCRDQLDLLAAFNETSEAETARLNRMSILSVNIDGDSHAAIDTIAAKNLGFPVLFDTDKIVSRLYDPNRLPMTVMVDPHGIVRYIHEGYQHGDQALYERELAELLAE